MNETDALSRLADIELPPPPTAPAWWLWIALAMTLAIILGITVWRRRKRFALSPAALARAHITALEQQWNSRRVDDRDMAYRLATMLRLGLELNQLQADKPPPAADPNLWRATLALLSQSRYTPASSALCPEVFTRLRGWLSAVPQES